MKENKNVPKYLLSSVQDNSLLSGSWRKVTKKMENYLGYLLTFQLLSSPAMENITGFDNLQCMLSYFPLLSCLLTF